MRIPPKSALPRATSPEDDKPLSELFPRRGQNARGAGTQIVGLPPSKRARVDDASTRPRSQLPLAAAALPQAPEAPPANEASKAPRQQTVGKRTKTLWYSGKRRLTEFGPVRTAYQSKLTEDAKKAKQPKPKLVTGGKFLAKILELTKSPDAKPLKLKTNHQFIRGYSILVPGTKQEVHVLRRDEPNGFPGDIRRLSEVTPKAMELLVKEMDSSAGMGSSTSARRRTGQKLSPRVSKMWSGKRAEEFKELHQACKDTDRQLTGPRFLDMLYRLTNEPGVKRSTSGLPAGIERFDITIPDVGPVQVLRRLDANQELADLRLVPPKESEGYVLDDMTRWIKPDGEPERAAPRQVDKSSKTYQNRLRWSTWRSLKKNVDAEYEQFRLHEQSNNRPVPTGAMFVKHLDELCNRANTAKGGAEDGITRHVITPDGCDKPITVLRRQDEQGFLAAMRKVDDASKTAEIRKEMIASIRPSKTEVKLEAGPAGSTAPSKRSLDGKAEMPAKKKPRPQATELKHALEMKQVLQLMLENQKKKRPPLDGVEAKTKLSGESLRTWIGPDGMVVKKRTPNSFRRLNGYFELRPDLYLLLDQLGQPAIAESLPQPMTAALLAQTLKARFDNPTALTAAPLARLVKANPKVVEINIDARTGSLLMGKKKLSQMPGYAAHRAAIGATLGLLGLGAEAKRLPKPETPAKTFMRDLKDNLRRVSAMIDAMRHERLTPAKAAQREGVSPELLDQVIGPGGTVRDATEIAARLPGFLPEQRPELNRLMAQLHSPAPSGMSRVLIKGIQKTSEKLFIVRSGNAASGTSEKKTLAKVFAHSPELVQSARSYKAERPRQALRWLSTVLRNQFEDAVEIKSYHDRKNRTIWVSSNKSAVNERILTFLSDAGLKTRLAKTTKLDHASRLGRHESKLRAMLSDSSARPDSSQAREVLKVMSEGRFRVPVESFHHDGHELDYHAERRIKAAFTRETGKALDLAAMGGTMRPCGTCAEALGLPNEARRGPFWQSRSARAFTDMEAVVQRNIEQSIGSYVTKMRDSQLSVHYDTESDSDADVPGRLAKREPSPLAPGAVQPFGLPPAWGNHRPRHPRPAPVRGAAAATAPLMPAAAWPIAQGERDFVSAYLRQDVPDPQQARQMLREQVLAQVTDFNDGAWHREEAYGSVDAVLAQIGTDTGADIARAVRLAQELGDAELPASVHAITLGRRATELQGLQAQALDAHLLLARLGATVPGEPPVGAAATQQVLAQLVDEGSNRFADFMHRLEANRDLRPTPAEHSELVEIGTQAAALRRSAALLGWLPTEASPTQPLPPESRQPGVIWSEAQTEGLFTRGRASGVGNNCWFDAIAQLSLNQPRGLGGDARVEQLAQRLRQAADRLGLSGAGEMFDDTNGQMHLIARAMGVQVHAFGQLPDGALRLSPLESVGSPQSRPVYIRSDDVHFEPMWPTWQAPSAGQAPVKAEPADAASSAAPARAPLYVETQLDQARTAFPRELGQICDLTGKQAEWRTHFDGGDMAIVRHDMAPMPENDHKFPLRDPADALRRAHPCYADEDGDVHPLVQLDKMQLRTGFRRYFQTLRSKDARLRVGSGSLSEAMTTLEKDAASELQRLIRGQVEPLRCTPRLLRDSDVQPHERMLVGQHGLFVPRPEDPADRPTLSNGRILGIFMGALVETDQELEQIASLHPDYERYAIDAHPRGNRQVMYSGLGATNSIAFANTALKPDSAEPAVDRERVNALFIEFDASLTDNKGKPRVERLVAMVALDNLFDGDKADAQVLVDYGDNFLENFKKDVPGVKQEPASPR